MDNREEMLFAAERWMDRAYDSFIKNLTERQLNAWESKGLVPKSKAHQRRYKTYRLACDEHQVWVRRSIMRVVANG